MKIAVASDDQVDIALHFGRTKGFLIYEIENETIVGSKYVLNTFTAHGNGHHHHENSGHHHSHDRVLNALEDCSVVISHGMGQRMLRDFENVGKEVFITSAPSAEEAVKLYIQGNLKHDPDKSCHED